MARIVIEEPCPEHGLVDRHCICNDLPGDPQHGEWCYCQGTRRVLTEGEYVLIEKVDGEWPEWAVESLSDPPLYELSPSAQRELGGDGEAVKVKPRFILDALAGGEQP